MKREADNNRVWRAIEHLNAAITNLKSIKQENMTRQERNSAAISIDDIDWIRKRLVTLTEEEK